MIFSILKIKFVTISFSSFVAALLSHSSSFLASKISKAWEPQVLNWLATSWEESTENLSEIVDTRPVDELVSIFPSDREVEQGLCIKP